MLVPHIINRYYILDLNDDASVVRSFCRRHFSVYLIDWGAPTTKQTEVGFGNYASYVKRAVALVSNQSVSLLGYCTGRLFRSKPATVSEQFGHP